MFVLIEVSLLRYAYIRLGVAPELQRFCSSHR
jgi:hypothetical protein